ncbi:MAG: N-acetylmuramoyl-L-alanine amidase [Candidatus Acidiferrales bacterium]
MALGKLNRTAKCLALVLALMAWGFAPSNARADKRTEARDQFDRAIRMRTALESNPLQQRSIGDYRATIAAYHKVYLISTSAEEVTPSLIAEAELYEQMGRAFDPKYFQNAIQAHQFLLKQYPESHYRSQALYSIAMIEEYDLHESDAAEIAFKQFLKQYPKSDKANGAREALKEIAEAREKAKATPVSATTSNAPSAPAAAPAASAPPVASELPDIKGPVLEQKESAHGVPMVTALKTWNTDRSARIVVTLDGIVAFDAARITAPDRIYFDLHKARLSAGFGKKPFDVKDGLLKSVRIGQNKDGVVRLVLDVNGARDYNAMLLGNPYRLVIDVHAANGTGAVTNSPTNHSPVSSATSTPVTQPAEETNVVHASNTMPGAETPKAESKPATKNSLSASYKPKPGTAEPPTESKPTRDGQRSLSRALGLKVSRIVIDPGHGGHDTGTIGPHGLMEKDLCLDVALRLGQEIEQKLPGAEVVYTRKDDTFVPLEQRTAIANDAKADLFISIHANSSHDSAARGIETYYLNFATSEESMEVASRENAQAQESMHDLQDIIKKIARNEKIEESKELATDIQDSLSHRMQLVSSGEKNRGVKKAPFVVLIGANMPSVLSEISFISNPGDEKMLRKTDQRQHVADGLYRGVAAYLDSVNSLSFDKSKLVSDNHIGSGGGTATVAAEGNPK